MNIIQKMKWVMGTFVLANIAHANAIPNTNPCDVQCAKKLIAQSLAANPAIGTYSRTTWNTTCPGGNQGLINGCFLNSANAANSPIRFLVKQMFNSYNTRPTSTPNAVYIKKFSPGSISTSGTGAITFDGTAVTATTQIACNPFLESGINIENQIVNTPTSGANYAHNDFLDTYTLLGGSSTLSFPLIYTGPGTLPLAVPLYVVCVGIGLNDTPASILGMAAYS